MYSDILDNESQSVLFREVHESSVYRLDICKCDVCATVLIERVLRSTYIGELLFYLNMYDSLRNAYKDCGKTFGNIHKTGAR